MNILITGAGKRIGKEIAKNFAKEGDTIVVVAGMPFGISGSTNSIRVVEI